MLQNWLVLVQLMNALLDQLCVLLSLNSENNDKFIL